MLNVLCLTNRKSFLFDLVSEICYVRFIEVKFHLGTQVSVRFTQVSALEFRFIEVSLWKFDQKTAWAKFFVCFSQVSALEHVPFRQVLL